MIETHTYPDGSQRIGSPPFPKLSPLEEQEAALRGEVMEQAEPQPAKRGRPAKNKDAE